MMDKGFKLVCVEPAKDIRLTVQPLDIPSPAQGQVVVRVEASSVNPIDAKRAAGYGRRLLRLKGAASFPLVLGNDLFGTVVSVGQGSGNWRPGDRVFGLVPTGKAGGSHASHVAVDGKLLRPAIPGLHPEAHAALPYTFTTLWLSLAGAGIASTNARGLKVLVHGASGGLGQLALQLLRRWGAETTAICSTANRDICEALGAATIWDRTRQPLRDLPDHFDASLNFGTWQDEALLLSHLKQGALGHATAVHPLLGNFDNLGLLRGAWRSWRDFRAMRARASARCAAYRWVVFQPNETALTELHQRLAREELTLAVGVSVPVTNAKAAFDHVVHQGKGRAILTLG